MQTGHALLGLLLGHRNAQVQLGLLQEDKAVDAVGGLALTSGPRPLHSTEHTAEPGARSPASPPALHLQRHHQDIGSQAEEGFQLDAAGCIALPMALRRQHDSLCIRRGNNRT